MKCFACHSEMREEYVEEINKTFLICPICPDTSEQERNEAKVAKYISIAGIPERERRVLEEGVVEDNDNREAFKIAKEYCDNIQQHLKDGTGIIFMGTVGAGKSIVTARMVHYFARKLVLCRWMSFLYFANMIEGNTVDSEDSAEAELYRFERYPVLIIDDLCCDEIASWQKKKLKHIINERHEKVMPTIFTMNCNDEDIIKILGPAMWSRMQGDNKIVVMTGKDRRIK